MKNIVSFVAFIVLMISLTSCMTRISPTEVGFKIDNAGDYRGIDSLPLLTGWQFYIPGQSYIVTLPTTQEHVAWTESNNEGSSNDEAITVACSGGAGFKMDVGLNYQIIPNKASKLYLKYKTDDLKTITNGFLRNTVRRCMQDVSGLITVDSILTNLPAYEHAVNDLLNKQLEPQGITLIFSVLKQPTPTDPNLAKSIAAKIQAKQDAERAVTELQSSIAEANKKIADARGDSASRVIKASSEAREIMVKQEALRQSPQYIELVKAQRWDGHLSQVQGGGSGMILQLKQP
jgi:regulator of protease activity HflC (stomatin/prohibitin superfamily)